MAVAVFVTGNHQLNARLLHDRIPEFEAFTRPVCIILRIDLYTIMRIIGMVSSSFSRGIG